MMRNAQLWQVLIALVFIAVYGFAVRSTRAAVYNFYFNNTEQGDNSTASPSVTVKTDEPSQGESMLPVVPPSPAPLAEASPVPPPVPVATPAPEPERATASAESVAEVKTEPAELQKEFHDNRLSFGVNVIVLSGDAAEFNLDRSMYGTGGIAVDFRATELWSLTGWVAKHPGDTHWFGGGDVNFLPLRFDLWWKDGRIEAGLLAGASSHMAFKPNLISLHGGARVNLNAFERLGLTGAFRANLGYYMAEAGVLFRL